MAGPTREFWPQRFVANETPWDRGAASPQLAAWLASGALTPCRILVPGCGGGYEVVALAQAGFNVTALDYAPAAIALTRERLAQANTRATLLARACRRRGVHERQRPLEFQWQACPSQGSIWHGSPLDIAHRLCFSTSIEDFGDNTCNPSLPSPPASLR
jgi:SAM-dependent methyltransferase